MLTVLLIKQILQLLMRQPQIKEPLLQVSMLIVHSIKQTQQQQMLPLHKHMPMLDMIKQTRQLLMRQQQTLKQ